MSPHDDRYFVTALARGLQVLEAFAGDRHQLSLTEIAACAGLDKSTAFRFVYTLEQLGYLDRDPQTRMVRPSLRLLRFGFAALNSLELVQVAQPRLKALSDRCGETTNMSIRDGGEIVYVARNKTQGILNVGLEIGSRLPVWCTSMGKAQLIDLSPGELRALLGDGPFPAAGPKAALDLAALLCDLEGVRQRGYAVNDEELAAEFISFQYPR